MSNYSKILDLAKKDPALFSSVISSLEKVIDLAKNNIDESDAEQKFSHSRDLFRAQALLDQDLQTKGALAKEALNLLIDVALHALIKV